MSNKLLEDFMQELTTLWSFPERGNWATHNPKYRGDFAPQIPHNIILNYSREGDTILDPMVDSGTTLIECKLLHRNGIGIDINVDAVELTLRALNFKFETSSVQEVYQGDIRALSKVKDNSIDLICTHPPYLNLVTYSNGKIEGDLSNITSPQKFCNELDLGIRYCSRRCSILRHDCFSLVPILH